MKKKIVKGVNNFVAMDTTTLNLERADEARVLVLVSSPKQVIYGERIRINGKI